MKSKNNVILKVQQSLIVFLGLLFLASLFTGCYRTPGPFETAGRKLDEDIQTVETGTERIGNNIDDLIAEIERTLESNGRALDRAL